MVLGRRCQRRASAAAYGPPVRWDDLFDDLAGQASAVLADELRTETDERARAELGRMSLLDRLAVGGAQVVDVDLVDGRRVRGRLAGVGDGWCRLEDDRDELLLPGRALARVSSVSPPSPGPTDRPLQARLGLRPVLRALVRRRVYVRVGSTAGSTTGGTLDAVGADHLELAEHPADRPRRSVEVRAVSLVPFDALLVLRYERS